MLGAEATFEILEFGKFLGLHCLISFAALDPRPQLVRARLKMECRFHMSPELSQHIVPEQNYNLFRGIR